MTSFETQLQFSRALTVVRAMPIESPCQPSANDKLRLYGLFKQATQGDCNQQRPSSRLIVQHAKWKAWDQLRHVSPIDAQKEYVRLLISLLNDFISRLPHHDMTTVLQRSLQYVQSNNGTISEEMLANASLDTDHRLLQHIEAHELTEDDNVGMLAGPVQSSNSTTASTYTYPVTPDLSPSQQHQLQQRKQQWYDRNRSHALLHQHRAHQDSAFYDGFSDADTLDREVAATTSGLGLVSPEQSPYYSLQARALQHATNGTPSTSNNGQINGNINGNGLLRDNPVPEPTRSTATVSETRRRRKSTAAASSASHLSISEQALEALQTQVAALTEQLEHMKLRLVAKEEHKRQMRWSWLWMTKTVAKHALINLVILFLVFMLLLRRRSPIAYAIIGYVGPRLQDLLRYFRKRLFFFVTV